MKTKGWIHSLTKRGAWIICVGLLACSRTPRESDLCRVFRLEHDSSDWLVLRSDHTFLHSYKEDGKVLIERGDWALFSKSKTVGFDTKSLSCLANGSWDSLEPLDPPESMLTKPTSSMLGWHNLIGDRESEVVVYSDETIFQGGAENVDWYRSIQSLKP